MSKHTHSSAIIIDIYTDTKQLRVTGNILVTCKMKCKECGSYFLDTYCAEDQDEYIKLLKDICH